MIEGIASAVVRRLGGWVLKKVSTAYDGDEMLLRFGISPSEMLFPSLKNNNTVLSGAQLLESKTENPIFYMAPPSRGLIV